MVTKITLYIGADNSTHKLTDEYVKKIQKILSKYWGKFTLTKHEGYYEGYIEESISAVIIVLRLIFKELDECVAELKVKLNQETIGVEVEANVDFVLK